MPDSEQQEKYNLQTVVAIMTRLEKQVKEIDEKLDERNAILDSKISVGDNTNSHAIYELSQSKNKLFGAIGVIHWVGGSISAVLLSGAGTLIGLFIAHSLDLNTLHSEIKRHDTQFVTD